MEQREEMDLRVCDQVWQRVAPELNPYPEVRTASAETSCRRGCRNDESSAEQVLGMAIEGELAARRAYLAHARCAGGNVGRALSQIAAEDGQHACRLRSIYFLLTGECFRSSDGCGQEEIMSLCQFLRQRYQMETRAAERYDRWADRMDDSCMANILRQLAEDDRCHAATVMRLLENRLG